MYNILIAPLLIAEQCWLFRLRSTGRYRNSRNVVWYLKAARLLHLKASRWFYVQTNKNVTELLGENRISKLFVRRKNYLKSSYVEDFAETCAPADAWISRSGINAGISRRSLADKCVSRARDDEWLRPRRILSPLLRECIRRGVDARGCGRGRLYLFLEMGEATATAAAWKGSRAPRFSFCSF